MSAGFHRLGANVTGKLPGFSNRELGSYRFIVDNNDDLKAQLRVESIVPARDPVHPETELRPLTHDKGTARQMGYTGDQCSNCQSMKMKISGHCMVCEDCGTTTGCS